MCVCVSTGSGAEMHLQSLILQHPDGLAGAEALLEEVRTFRD